jgi:hypothetical protein
MIEQTSSSADCTSLPLARGVDARDDWFWSGIEVSIDAILD